MIEKININQVNTLNFGKRHTGKRTNTKKTEKGASNDFAPLPNRPDYWQTQTGVKKSDEFTKACKKAEGETAYSRLAKNLPTKQREILKSLIPYGANVMQSYVDTIDYYYNKNVSVIVDTIAENDPDILTKGPDLSGFLHLPTGEEDEENLNKFEIANRTVREIASDDSMDSWNKSDLIGEVGYIFDKHKDDDLADFIKYAQDILY